MTKKVLRSDDVEEEANPVQIDIERAGTPDESEDEGHGNMSTIRYSTRGEGTDPGLHGKKELIMHKRAVLKWMPVLCTNDIVHGSWWFVWGSLLAMLTAVIPLVDAYVHFFDSTDDSLPVLQFTETWALLIISGFFFTLGSYCFVRAFEEPERHPLFTWRHIATDELLGAWLFLFGTIPAVPYSLVYWFLYPEEMIYFLSVIVSSVCVLATYLFVLACYPSTKKHKQFIKPCARVIFGRRHWIIKHLQNDWLAGMWFFFYASLIGTIGSIGFMLAAFAYGTDTEKFVYTCSFVDCLWFTIGSMYFVAGSYPSDHLKCYKAKSMRDERHLMSAEDEEGDDTAEAEKS